MIGRTEAIAHAGTCHLRAYNPNVSPLLLLLAQTSSQTALDYSGLPILNSAMPYRVLTHGVTLDIGGSTGRGPNGSVFVSSTTVYRHQGGAEKATIVIPRHRQGDGAPDFDVTATWDNAPLELQPTTTNLSGDASPGTESDLTATVPLRQDGTHALRISYSTSLQHMGYNGTQRKAAYLLDGKQPIELLSIAYRYPPQVVFGLPIAEPEEGWEIGSKGASARLANITPPNQVSDIVFYPNSFKPIGK